jgi:hypothetical protein
VTTEANPEKEANRRRQKTKAATAKRFAELLEHNKRLRADVEEKDMRIRTLETELAAAQAAIPKPKPVPPTDEWYLGWVTQHLPRRNSL